MQITTLAEKTRSEIALLLPSLGLEEAKAIATECHCSHDTVYREWRKIKGTTPGKVLSTNPVVQCLIELAIKRKKLNEKAQKKAAKIMKQLSAA